MKYFISFSILLFVSFTASAQAKKSKQEIKKETSATTNSNSKKDYLFYVRSFADTLLAYGTDRYELSGLSKSLVHLPVILSTLRR